MTNSCMLDFSTIWSAQNVGYGFNPGIFDQVDSLLSLIDAIVVFDEIHVPYIPSDGYGMHDFLSPLIEKGIVLRTTLTGPEKGYLGQYVSQLSSSQSDLAAYVKSVVNILRLPWYEQALMLFGHHGVFRYFEDVGESTLLLSGEEEADKFTEAINALLLRFRAAHGSRIADQFFSVAEGSNTQARYFPDMDEVAQLGSFLLRGLCYNEIARIRGLSFFPHPLRAVVCLYSGLGGYSSRRDVSASVLKSLQELRMTVVTGKERALGPGFFDLRLPPLAATVLRKAQTAHDVLEQALILRESKGAKDLRKWLSEAQASLVGGDASRLVQVADHLEGLRRAILLEFGLEEEKANTNPVGVSLGLFSYTPRTPTWLRTKMFRVTRRRHLQFLYESVKRSSTISSLEPDIVRLFWPDADQPHGDQHILGGSASESHLTPQRFTYPLTLRNPSHPTGMLATGEVESTQDDNAVN